MICDVGRRKWKGKPEAQAAVYANRRRIDPVDKPREDVGHVLGPGFPAIMHQGLLRRLLSGSLPGGDGRLLFLTGSTITSCITGGGSVFVTRALTSRCLREYCSGYLRSNSQADAVHVGGRVISTISWNVFWSSPSPIVRTVFRVSTDDSLAASWIFLRWWARKSASAFFSLSTNCRNRPDLAAWPCAFHAVSNVIVSQSSANNRPAGEVQSEVELAPAAAYSLGVMLLR